jgi:S-formylglutathione hydrolase FrmB
MTSAPDPQPDPQPAGRTTRRTMLLGSLIGVGSALTAAGVLVEREVLPGRVALARTLGQDGRPGTVPAGAIGALRRGRFTSPARAGITTNWVIAYPPGVDPDRLSAGPSPASGQPASGQRLPVCVVLHGKGDNAESMVTLGYPNFLAAAVRAGRPPFALASVDGGNQYWHARRDGEDPGKMVLDEWLPRLAQAGLAARAADRIAFLGWSMGGYGSLLLSSQLGPARVAAIVAESPALWLNAHARALGSFDDAADFQAHDVFARRELLSKIPTRIDCGTADSFHSAVTAFVSGLRPAPLGDLGAGDHTYGYWRSKAAKTIEFIGNQLTRA